MSNKVKPSASVRKSQQRRARSQRASAEQHAMHAVLSQGIGTLLEDEVPPMERLEIATFLSEAVDRLMSDAVADARALDIGWKRIGDALGMSAPGAQSRFAKRGELVASDLWLERGEAFRAARADAKVAGTPGADALQLAREQLGVASEAGTGNRGVRARGGTAK